MFLCALVSCVALLVAGASNALAQCSMCRLSAQAAGQSASASSALNLAILVLLIPPVLMFCGIFLAAYRSSRAASESRGQKV